jgi:predicted nuclease of predicted toxin-antitoxin system
LSTIRFLIDENLSIYLPAVAHRRGFEATHVNYRGLNQAKDWDILKVIEVEGWVLVTNNVFEFRGRFKQIEIHPGIVFLVPTVPRGKQIELFSAVLDEIASFPEMVNVAVDVSYRGDQIVVNRYALP